MNKGGISQVVTTLIIILLSIVAIGVVWVVVKNVIDKGKEDISLDALGLDLEIVKASYLDDTLSITVKRNAGGGELVGINFVISDEDNSVVVKKDTNLLELGRETFTFILSNLAVDVITEISVAPIYLTDSDKEVTGDILDTSTSGSSGSLGTGGGSGAGGDGGNGENGGNGDPVCGNGLCEIGETPSSCSQDCTEGGPVCGNDIIESPETCDDGNIIDGDGCSSSCQTEGGGGTCNNDGICDVTETVGSCPNDCGSAPSSCDGTWNQTDIDDGNECDGGGTPGDVPNCQINCICEIGFGPDDNGNCIIDSPINFGNIFSVWNYIYIDSVNLPTIQSNIISYVGYYINFTSSSEVRCFQITFADIADTGRGYVRLDNSFGAPVDLISGDGYNVWEAENCGQ